MNRSITTVSATPRERYTLTEPGELTLALQVQRCGREAALADVLYVHGATFGADLSLYFAFEGRSLGNLRAAHSGNSPSERPYGSWADALCEAGFDAWGFDFAGYGDSQRYPETRAGMPCDIDDAGAQLRRVVAAVRARNGGRPLVLLGHSHGGTVAARHAALHADDVRALVLFAPVVTRPETTRSPAAPTQAHYPLTVWAQYRRFIEDVPRGHAPVLADAHYDAWSAAFLRSDRSAAARTPPAVMTPSGPLADIAALWRGQSLYDASRIVAPTLLVSGQWDSVCDERDAAALLATLGSMDKLDLRIERATHLMHLEAQRGALHDAVNRFLLARV